MFRLQNNVPEVYVQESRDFQIFCRLYDVIQSSVKFSIDSITNISSTKNCNSSLLELLKTKQGLFSTVDVSNDNLRLVLDAFPHIMRYKGSLKGITYILNLFSRLVDEQDTIGRLDESMLKDHKIRLIFPNDLKNDKLLIELLKYVLPTGYFIEYDVAKLSNPETYIELDDSIEITTFEKNELNNISKVFDNSNEKYEQKNKSMINSVGLTQVARIDEEAQNE